MTPRDELRERLRSFLVPDEFVAVWAGEPLPDPSPLEDGRPDTWLAAPLADGTWLVGGLDRGRFAPYDRYETIELCANAVRHLYVAPVEPVTLSEDDAQAALLAAADLTRRVAAEGAVGEIPVGTALDRYGPLSGHVLFAWRTPFPQRSAPPTDLQLGYTQLIVRRPLPAPFSTGTMRPWFGQPGGGPAVSLPRCVRWYFDAGVLDCFVTTGQRERDR